MVHSECSDFSVAPVDMNDERFSFLPSEVVKEENLLSFMIPKTRTPNSVPARTKELPIYEINFTTGKMTKVA